MRDSIPLRRSRYRFGEYCLSHRWLEPLGFTDYDVGVADDWLVSVTFVIVNNTANKASSTRVLAALVFRRLQ